MITQRLPAATLVALLAASCVIAGCSTPSTSPAATAPAEPTVKPTVEPTTQTPVPSASMPVADVQPGRPYRAEDVLSAMRDSRRPGGVDERLQTSTIAQGVAALLWTWDGTAWDDLAIGGACGTEMCTLEVTGSTDARAGADAYSFAIAIGSSDVRLADADLHGYPPSLETDLEAIARSGVTASRLEGLALVGARWMAPPDAGRYWLSYRSGGEEGSPGLDILVDLTGGEVLSITEAG